MTNDKLDRLAAEKVMGWNLNNKTKNWMIPSSVVTGYAGSIKLGAMETKYFDKKREESKRWQPTRNIAQAWECLEKLVSEGHEFTLDYYRNRDTKHPTYEAELKTRIRIDDIYCTFAATAPLAIVKACLKAKGVEID